jgi:CheY-like chemotaxis protein
MPRGGTVSVETSNTTFEVPYAIEHFEVAPGPYVVLAVSDTGVGMDDDTRQHVFEPFFTTKEVGKGTGLGLATVYGIVQGAGGHIWLYSEPGLGTTFKLYFPNLDATEAAAVPPEPSRADLGRGRVLLVEDERLVRDAARVTLERAGFQVRAVGDAREALGLLGQPRRPFDVLVTDMVMPGLSGRDLASRALSVEPPLGVVVLSGYAPETSEVAGLVAAGARFASKPIPPRDLVALVADVVPSTSTPRAARSKIGGR